MFPFAAQFVNLILETVLSFQMTFIITAPDPAVSFVENLDIADPEIDTPPPDLSQRGYVAGGSLVAFSENIDANSKQDILNATLFAQLASNKKFNREEKLRDWHKFYTLVLKNLGFIIKNMNFKKYEEKMDTFTMEDVIKETHNGSSSNTEEMRELLDAMMNALRKKPVNDTCIRLFTSLCCCSGTIGNFQVIPCHRGPDGVIFFLLGTYAYKGEKHEENILFSKWNSETTTLYKSVQKVTFDPDAYKKVKYYVSFKLKDAASRLVASLCIDDSSCKA